MNLFSFITLTNIRYLDITKNCLESLNKIGLHKLLKVYCDDQESYNILKETYNNTHIIGNNLKIMKNKKKVSWRNIAINKFQIIYNELLNSKYVCITDGDIVFENKNFIQYLFKYIENSELVIQNDTLDNNDFNNLCSGFMFIKSNSNTCSLFNPENIKYKNFKSFADQIYINLIKIKLNYRMLPLELFPNGNYYYKFNKNIKPYLIHFNWVKEKKKQMIKYNKWLLE